uniref:Uncharacterized protein n=1 Tax=Aegilops tauschii subsp. strangulata TaxID=200361 RepID=A0A453IA60_AEGTS
PHVSEFILISVLWFRVLCINSSQITMNLLLYVSPWDRTKASQFSLMQLKRAQRRLKNTRESW